MRIIHRLFPRSEVREALRCVKSIEQSLRDLGEHLGFEAIKTALRQRIIDRPEELITAIKTTGYSIQLLVLILARNIVCDQLESGMHHTFFTQTTMTGDGLKALHSHLTDLIEQAGAETAEEAQASKRQLRETLNERFRP